MGMQADGARIPWHDPLMEALGGPVEPIKTPYDTAARHSEGRRAKDWTNRQEGYRRFSQDIGGATPEQVIALVEAGQKLISIAGPSAYGSLPELELVRTALAPWPEP